MSKNTRSIRFLIKASKKASAGSINQGKIPVKKMIRGKSGKLHAHTYWESVTSDKSRIKPNISVNKKGSKQESTHLMKNLSEEDIQAMKSNHPAKLRYFFSLVRPIGKWQYNNHNLNRVGVEFDDALSHYNVVAYNVLQRYIPVSKSGHKASLSTVIITALRNKSINLYKKHKRELTSFSDDLSTSAISDINVFDDVSNQIKEKEDKDKIVKRVKELKQAIGSVKDFIENEPIRPPNVTDQTKKKHLRIFDLFTKGYGWGAIAKDKIAYPNGASRHAVINVFKKKFEPKVLKELNISTTELGKYAKEKLLTKAQTEKVYNFGWAYLYYKMKTMMGEPIESNVPSKIIDTIYTTKLAVLKNFFGNIINSNKAQKIFYKITNNADIFSMTFINNLNKYDFTIDNEISMNYNIDNKNVTLSDNGSLSMVQYKVLTAAIQLFLDEYDLINPDLVPEKHKANKVFKGIHPDVAYYIANIYAKFDQITNWKDSFKNKVKKIQAGPNSDLNYVYSKIFDYSEIR